MNRSTTLPLVAGALVVYGVYVASYVPAMLVGAPVPLVLIGFVLQTMSAVAAALGVWRGERWAAGMVVLLGASIAGTWIFEGFVLGIVAYLRAVLVAVLALVISFFIAAYVNRQRDTLKY